MLRATSEIAVTISVRSVLEKPSCDESFRPFSRAATTSASDLTLTRTSSLTVARLLRMRIQERQSLLEVESRVHVLETHAELHHRERHLGLDPYDHRLGASQPGHVRDAPQRPRGERVHDVQRRDVDDDPARAEAPDLLHEVVLELEHIAVAEGRLNRRDQVVALFEDRNGHQPEPARPSGSPPLPPRPSSPRSRADAPPPRYLPGGRRRRSSCS